MTGVQTCALPISSIIVDAPISLPGARKGEVWSPQNYEAGKVYGPQPIRKGLELSRNLMTVRLAMQVGMDKITANAKKWGVVDQMDPVLAMALGAGETTPYRLTAAYSIFPNGGRKIIPHLIEVVQDREGKLIYDADERKCQTCRRAFGGEGSPRLAQPGEQVLDPITSYEVTSMLEGVVQRGTAVAARSLNRHIAGKTGTTNDYRSAWFVGFSQDLVVGVFVGFDDNRSLGHGEAGAVAAVPIFIDFMGQAMKGKPDEPFKKPKGAKYLMINGVEEAFRPDNMPKRAPAPTTPTDAIAGPQPYDQVWKNGQVSGADNATGAVAPPPPPPKKKAPEDLEGLY